MKNKKVLKKFLISISFLILLFFNSKIFGMNEDFFFSEYSSSELAQIHEYAQKVSIEKFFSIRPPINTKTRNIVDWYLFIDNIRSGSLSNLKILSLHDCDIDDSKLIELSLAIKIGKLPLLYELDLSNNDIRDEGLLSLIDTIKSGALNNLKKLNLNSNRITDSGAFVFQDLIKSRVLSNLEILDLSLTMVTGKTKTILREVAIEYNLRIF